MSKKDPSQAVCVLDPGASCNMLHTVVLQLPHWDEIRCDFLRYCLIVSQEINEFI